MFGLAVTALQFSTRVPAMPACASWHEQLDPVPRTHSYATQMQVKVLSQQTPCCPGILTTEVVLQAPTWDGSSGPQAHPNGSAEQCIAVPPDPSTALPSWPSTPAVPLPAA